MSDHQGTGRGLLMCNKLFEDFLDAGRPSIYSLGVYDENRQFRNVSSIIECNSYTSTKGGQVYDVKPLMSVHGILGSGDWEVLYEGGDDIPEFESDILNEFRKLEPEIPPSDLVCYWSYNDIMGLPCNPSEFMKGENPNFLTKEEHEDFLQELQN